MPPSIRYRREDVISAALNVVRRDGMDGLNARALARELGCSTQPLFREFASMAEIRQEVRRSAFDLYSDYIRKSASADRPRYKSAGMAYILFARDEPELFKVAFMCDRSGGEPVDMRDDPNMPYVLDTIMSATGFTREQAASFHLRSWIYAHGLATMLATRYVNFTDEQLEALLSDHFLAMKLLYQGRIDAGEPCDTLGPWPEQMR